MKCVCVHCTIAVSHAHLTIWRIWSYKLNLKVVFLFRSVLVITVLVWEPRFACFFPLKVNQQHKILKKAKKLPSSPIKEMLRQIGPWVHELWSDIQTNRETDRKNTTLYIYKLIWYKLAWYKLVWYKLALPGDYSWKFRIFTPRWEHYFHRVPQSEYQENRSMGSWVMIGLSKRQTDNRDN